MEASNFNQFDCQVATSNNGRHGIAIHLNSNGKLIGEVLLQSNAANGLSIRDGSMLLAKFMTVNGNRNYAISVDNGGNLNCCDLNISGNSENDLMVTFGSRATLYNDTIENIGNDGSSLIRYENICFP